MCSDGVCAVVFLIILNECFKETKNVIKSDIYRTQKKKSEVQSATEGGMFFAKWPHIFQHLPYNLLYSGMLQVLKLHSFVVCYTSYKRNKGLL